MIATKDSFEPHSSEQLPNSSRVYLPGQIHADVQVPVREIADSDTKSYTGAIEKNAPVRVYDCSGPWGDPAFTGTSDEGLPALRRDWILKRGDVEEYDGREVKPQDNGYLSGKLAEYASRAEKNRLVEFPGLKGLRGAGVGAGRVGREIPRDDFSPQRSRTRRVCRRDNRCPAASLRGHRIPRRRRASKSNRGAARATLRRTCR